MEQIEFVPGLRKKCLAMTFLHAKILSNQWATGLGFAADELRSSERPLNNWEVQSRRLV